MGNHHFHLRLNFKEIYTFIFLNQVYFDHYLINGSDTIDSYNMFY